jgi:MATE family multidrug resistance protein
VGLGFWLDWDGLGVWIGLATGLAVVALLIVLRWIRREQLPQWKAEMGDEQKE